MRQFRVTVGHAAYDQTLYVGFAGMVILVPLVYLSESAFIAYYPKLFLLHFTLLYLAVVWFLRRRDNLLLVASPFTLPVVLYAAVGGLSVFQAVNRTEALVQFSQQVTLTLLFFVLLNNLKRQSLLRYLRPVVATAALVAVIGNIQYAGWGLQWIPTTGMPSATFGYRNYAAMYMAMCIPLGLCLFLNARFGRGILGWGMAVTLMSMFLVATRTRGAWLGLSAALFIACLMLLVLKKRGSLPGSSDRTLYRTHFFVFATGLVLTVTHMTFVAPRTGATGFDRGAPEKIELTSTIASLFGPNPGRGRTTLWQHTLEMIADHPFRGVGLGNWQYIHPAYDAGETIRERWSATRPHNDYLWIASELGLPGLILFLWILCLACSRGLRVIFGADSHSEVITALCIGTALLAILGHAFFSFPRERIAPSMLFWTLLAFVAILDIEQRPRSLTSFRGSWLILPGSILGVVLCLWLSSRAIAFDRHHAGAIASGTREEWQEVISEAGKALQYGMFDPQIYLERGLAHQHLGNFMQSVSDNLRCLDYHPYLINAHNNLGASYIGMRRFQSAIDAFQRVLELNPGTAQGHLNLGIANTHMRRSDAALRQFEQAAHATSDVKELAIIRYNLGVVYEQKGDYQQAAELYTQLLSEYPEDSTVRDRLNAVNQLQEAGQWP